MISIGMAVSETGEATTADVDTMRSWLERRIGKYEDYLGSDRDDAEYAFGVVLRYSRKKFGDMVPAYSAIWAWLFNCDDDTCHPDSCGGQIMWRVVEGFLLAKSLREITGF